MANDADAQRCNLLAHQTKRMCSPALVVVNHDATTLPLLRAPGSQVAYFDCGLKLLKTLVSCITLWALALQTVLPVQKP